MVQVVTFRITNTRIMPIVFRVLVFVKWAKCRVSEASPDRHCRLFPGYNLIMWHLDLSAKEKTFNAVNHDLLSEVNLEVRVDWWLLHLSRSWITRQLDLIRRF